MERKKSNLWRFGSLPDSFQTDINFIEEIFN